ncbi:efflux transporter outer membrane subunit [Caulobacter sp. S45]|uniref:efflux transporter outer membrane subunit n=1 Tax=Caulobacter sp. S45 TaxID=1641861 RepID=UPI00131CB390|nr:efflux transporter outer membrane subunit [Caulobacter sp. S45]
MRRDKSSRAGSAGAARCGRGGPFIAAALVMAAAGCTTVGPNFKPPAAPSTAGYTAPGERTVAEANPGPSAPKQTIALGEKVTADWWRLFQSPDLDGLVKQAIAGSPTLDAAKARLLAAREEINAATGALYPQVSLSAEAAREKQSAASFGLTAAQAPLPPNFDFFQIGPNVSYTPDFFGGTRRRIEQQSALADFQRDQLDAAYLTLTGNAVTQAIRVAAVRAQLKAVAEILEIDRQNLDLVRKERQAGTIPDSDVVTAESQLAADETLRPGLDQQLSAAKHALAVLTGRAPGDWSPPDFDLTTLILPGELPISLPSDLVHQRPDIQAAEAQLHASSARIGIATAQLYPSITLSAGISASSLNGGNLFSPAGLVWSIAGGLTQPVFDGGTRQAERRTALADFKASAADYQQTVLLSFGQVADILQALTHDADLLAAQQHALNLASESVRLQHINYVGGGSGLLGLLDAQRQQQQALLGYARAEAQRYQDTTQLLVAMGGGWWDASLAVADNTRAGERNSQ